MKTVYGMTHCSSSSRAKESLIKHYIEFVEEITKKKLTKRIENDIKTINRSNFFFINLKPPDIQRMLKIIDKIGT